ncbi:MAG TPA: DNA replication/repair protein RecF [Candidatus Salinicoccus stercoripullorum]|uniref:DNA replication and repair protein RecF n=1 Tax=Candidatus Salinicoccus stercoripullorum TaxID=2838756 RepID=A0A9D1QGA1_9STAP|nr:DNA replication/repair protein RecF [Candidatus Salinicoccus stercoripullorum]
MILKNIHLGNFRNYESLDLEFHPKLNVFIGRNAQGKTNLLESIYFLALAKSHRTAKDKELIRFKQEEAFVNGSISTSYSDLPLSISVSSKGKRAKVNHMEVARLSQYIGHLNVVLFAPEDLNIVKGSPQVRRKFINMECGQISKVYLNMLSGYQKVLAQKNNYLKQRNVDRVMIDVLNAQLAEHASLIILKRQQFIQTIEKYASRIHGDISNGNESLTVRYKPNIKFESEDEKSLELEIKSLLDDTLEKEIERGQALAGPHRDDISFYINDFDVQTYGSQGQQRTTALSVKLAELELIHEEIGEYPVLLLDDVLSELDETRQSHLLTSIRNRVQTFVTTTSISDINHTIMDEMQSFSIDDGKVKV